MNRGISIVLGIVVVIVSSGLYLCSLAGIHVPMWVVILILCPIVLIVLAYAVYTKVVKKKRNN